MIRKFLGAVAALILAMTITTTVTQTANATDDCLPVRSCGSVYHYTPDAGIDEPIRIDCNYGGAVNPADVHLVKEGESSKKYCYDADAIFVGTSRELWCKRLVGSPSDSVWVWQKEFDAYGWHKIDNWWSDGQGCTIRAD